MEPDTLKLSITRWIEDLKDGSDTAANDLWAQYFDRLVRLANRRLGNAPRRVADEEDIVVSVFHSLCDGASEGRLNQLSTRDDLWKLLVAMTRMKTADQVRRQMAKKRGGATVRGNSALDGPGQDDGIDGFDQFLAADATPEFLTAMDEQYALLMDALQDDTQRQVARHRMDGFPNEEIAKLLGISLRSVERKLKIVREKWALLLSSE